jgi:hypothetical protein
MPSVLDLIVAAIQQKLIVTATYQGRVRIMCPHVVGYKATKQHGQELNALFFQFAGESKSGLPPGGEWRCIHLDQLTNISTAPGEWHTAPDHSRPQTCVDHIIAEVVF